MLSEKLAEVRILAFGKIEEIVGKKEFIFNGAGDTDSLRQALAQQHPGLRGFKFAIAVDKIIVTGNVCLNEGSEVALLPPFSGG